MRLTTILYVVLGLIGLGAAIVVPASLYRSGSLVIPFWTAAVNPGPLSSAHEFIGAQCETCHTPTRGVEATACLTCHVTAAPTLLAQSATAFHANIATCAGCHVEHQGRDRRPINMDHSVLIVAGHVRAAEAQRLISPSNDADRQHALARVRAFLDGSGADIVGGSLGRRQLPVATMASLDCAGCHAVRDRHRTLFGRDCQSCHNVDTWAIAAFVHPSPRSENCVQCHQAPPTHYMMHFEMMDRTIAGRPTARVEQCFMCHQTDAWNQIRGVGWRDMH